MRILLLDSSRWFDFEALGHTVFPVALTACETPPGGSLCPRPCGLALPCVYCRCP
ncbi:MAG: hypothetical protein LBV01_05595 [Deltaproteobacteria bacterium]|jgi:hypothetical protein|nr:hypothetical protein [Deltaproteobacteria bacterium]